MALRRGFRLGIHCVQEGSSFPEMVAFWRQVEALGYDWISLVDHLEAVWFERDQPIYEASAALAALAAYTSKVRISTLAICNNFRNPGILAKEWATIDHISNGRLELGLGAGWNQREHDAVGIPYPSPADRIRMLEEALTVIKKLWTESSSTFEGRYYQLRDAVSSPKPLQKPYPPIWVCGAGEQLMLKVVARHADGWNPPTIGPEEYARRAAVLAGYCEAIQRDPTDITRSIAVMVVTAETTAAANALAEELQSRILTKLVPGKNIVVGDPASCASYLGEYLRLGVTEINVRMPPAPNGPRLAENFIRLVGPRLREMAG